MEVETELPTLALKHLYRYPSMRSLKLPHLKHSIQLLHFSQTGHADFSSISQSIDRHEKRHLVSFHLTPSAGASAHQRNFRNRYLTRYKDSSGYCPLARVDLCLPAQNLGLLG